MRTGYDNRTFGSIANCETGEVGSETVFHYHQEGDVVCAEYPGGEIIRGTLMAKVLEAVSLDMRYQHINRKGRVMTGVCTSIPELLPDGRIRLHERWQWTFGDQSSGESIIEEILSE